MQAVDLCISDCVCMYVHHMLSCVRQVWLASNQVSSYRYSIKHWGLCVNRNGKQIIELRQMIRTLSVYGAHHCWVPNRLIINRDWRAVHGSQSDLFGKNVHRRWWSEVSKRMPTDAVFDVYLSAIHFNDKRFVQCESLVGYRCVHLNLF